MQTNKNIQKLIPCLSIPRKIWHSSQLNILKLDWNKAAILLLPYAIENIKIFSR
ncbi:TPA: hypothetical protein SG435_001643 [Campylobacter coli]|nr:hypothetical protein [Campylobacter coli]HEH4748278.1 hypothetical protein [Campylobacter coli]